MSDRVQRPEFVEPAATVVDGDSPQQPETVVETPTIVNGDSLQRPEPVSEPGEFSAQPVKSDIPEIPPDSLPPADIPVKKPDRWAGYLQFPRRLILQILAFFLAIGGILILRSLMVSILKPPTTVRAIDWSISWSTRQPVINWIGQYLPNTLYLLMLAFLFTLILSVVAIVVSLLVRLLEKYLAPLASVLKGLGRLFIYGGSAVPAVCLSLGLLIIYAINLKLFPMGGIATVRPTVPAFLDRFWHLILPALSIAIYMAAVSAQAVVKAMVQPREHGGWRSYVAGLFKFLGTIFSMMGGVLSAAIIIEALFNLPGIGRGILTGFLLKDFPVVSASLIIFAVMILMAKLLAELFRAVERLIDTPMVEAQSKSWDKVARGIWMGLTVLLFAGAVLYPLLSAGGLSDLAQKTNSRAVFAQPSPENPWGTDNLGRDIRARTLTGAESTIALSALAAALPLLPAIGLGVLLGFLVGKRTLLFESLADVLLLPAEIMLYIPALPMAVLIYYLLRPVAQPGQYWFYMVLAIGITLLPRAVKTYQALWLSVGKRRAVLIRLLAGSISLFLGLFFTALVLTIHMDVRSLGLPAPAYGLGGVLLSLISFINTRSSFITGPLLVTWGISLAAYLAFDANLGYFRSKEAVSRLNE